MHSSIHTLAHRAPPATRSRVRWQPYNSAVASASTSSLSRSPSISSLSTPATTVSSPPPPKFAQLCDTKAQGPMPQTPRDLSTSQSSKNKYATGLVDQAVKSLCDIWRPQDIPNVFLTSSRATVGSCNDLPPTPAPLQSRKRNTQTLSPCQSSPLQSQSATAIALETARVAAAADQSNLVPIKGFVHEVLRRSRTSGSVLQTALCYLEAIRPKVPELIRQEQAGLASQEYDSESRVTLATAAELELEAQLSSFDLSECHSEDVMDTVRVSDNEELASTATPWAVDVPAMSDSIISNTLAKASNASSAIAPLPSPLLCPRRAFLASLILASKFTQDKCYSNRAWAKLSGLPAREIGRCERALGAALDWRLWVGKTPVASHSSSPSPTTTSSNPVANTRPVVRCRSEVNLSASSCKGSFLVQSDNRERTTNSNAVPSPVATKAPLTRGLRRASTLPANMFTDKDRQYPENYADGDSSYGSAEKAWSGEGHQLSFSNDAAQDELMASPRFSHGTISPPSPTPTYGSYNLSPITSPPSLSYSPSSTESSSGDSGDRTIQMTFMDDNMGSFSQDNVACGNEWGASSPTLSGIAFEKAEAFRLDFSATGNYEQPIYVPPLVEHSVPFGANTTNAWPWSERVEQIAIAKFSSAASRPAFSRVDSFDGLLRTVRDWRSLDNNHELGHISVPVNTSTLTAEC